MAKFSSKKIELGVLALFFVSPFHIKALSLDLDSFSIKKHKNLAKLIKKYISKYKAIPSKDTLVQFANAEIKDEKNIEETAEALLLLDDLPDIKKEEASYYFDQLQNYHVGRKLADLHDYIGEAFEDHHVDFVNVKKNLIQRALSIQQDDEEVKRGFIFDNIKDRFHHYERLEKGIRDDIVPFGIKKLDDPIGGMRKSTVTMAYSRTAGGKTTLALNLAYNAAIQNYNVMYVSLEMDYTALANCLDARMALIDSKKVLFGELNHGDKKSFAKALKKQLKDKIGIWIADIPQSGSVTKIMEELEIYKAANGHKPDLLVIDYANIAEPAGRYHDRSTKFDVLFREFKEMARFYEIALFTMMQESREASLRDLQKKQKKKNENVELEDGVHNIGASNYAATSCEVVIHLKQSETDMLRNRLWAVINKNRYGPVGLKQALFSAWDIRYIGDESITQKNTVVKVV